MTALAAVRRASVVAKVKRLTSAQAPLVFLGPHILRRQLMLLPQHVMVMSVAHLLRCPLPKSQHRLPNSVVQTRLWMMHSLAAAQPVRMAVRHRVASAPKLFCTHKLAVERTTQRFVAHLVAGSTFTCTWKVVTGLHWSLVGRRAAPAQSWLHF
jgi:hypothetical protein